MTRNLLHTIGVLAAMVTLLTGAAAAAPTQAVTDTTEAAIGPPGGLPDQVPDFVSGILETITQFLDGTLDGDLGEAVNDAARGGPD